jgi:hypothetical protein
VGTVYSSEAFIEYAKAQVDYAEAMLARHTLGGCGLCTCGRIHPCEHWQHWQQMRNHYEAVLGSHQLGPTLARPYVNSDNKSRPRP